MNKLFKYAGDMYLVVPASKSSTIESELQSIASRSETNNLTLNTKKSTEIVYKPKLKHVNLPPSPVSGIQRVSQMVVFEVTIHDSLFSFKPHIENLISCCTQAFYALWVLKSHGLNDIVLWDVGQAILLNLLLYASPVWGGFIDASDKQCLQAVLTRAQRLGPRHHYRNSVGRPMILSSLQCTIKQLLTLSTSLFDTDVSNVILTTICHIIRRLRLFVRDF